MGESAGSLGTGDTLYLHALVYEHLGMSAPPVGGRTGEQHSSRKFA